MTRMRRERIGQRARAMSDDACDRARAYEIVDIVDDEWARETLPDDGAHRANA